MYAIDLSTIAWHRKHGHITVYGTWIRTDSGWRPALALVRTGDETSDHCVPCIVSMDRLWVFDEQIGDEVKAGEIVAGFIDPLRLSADARTAIYLLSIIRDHMGDVLNIGVRPDVGARVVGEVRVTNSETGKTREAEIVENA